MPNYLIAYRRGVGKGMKYWWIMLGIVGAISGMVALVRVELLTPLTIGLVLGIPTIVIALTIPYWGQKKITGKIIQNYEKTIKSNDEERWKLNRKIEKLEEELKSLKIDSKE